MRTALRLLLAVPFLAAELVVTALGFTLSLLGLLVSPRSLRWASRGERLWGRGVLAVSCARLVVEGRERVDPDAPRVFVANHASYLDPPALFAALPARVRFVMKRQLFWFPFVGWYSAVAGHLLIDRDDPRKSRGQLLRGVERMRKRGLSLVVFPEGTRSPDGLMREFRMGGFEPALAGDFDVQPVAILGSHEILPKGAWVPRRCGTVRIRVGETIPTRDLPEGGAGRRILGERVRAALLALGVPSADPGLPDSGL